MFRKFHATRNLIFLGLMLAFSITVFADTLRLKDGSIIKGRIVGFTGGKFIVAVGEGSRSRQITFDASEVASVQFDSPPVVPMSVKVTGPVGPAPVEKDPQFIETSSPPKSVPRVITTDTIAKAKADVSSSRTNLPSESVGVKAKTGSSKPVEVSVKVVADNTSNGWTNSGWVVKKGQRIRIKGDGTVSLGGGKSTGPSGSYDLTDETKLLKSVPTGALIAVIGDDNNEFIYVGAERTFIASRDGALFLGVNEGNLSDNKGNFDVKIEIDPA